MSEPVRWTRAQVEDRIAQWNRDLQLATQNILELMDDIDYKTLAGDSLVGIALTGVTEQRVMPVFAALEELWQMMPLLGTVIDDANERYKKLPWFKDTEPLWAIQQMLEGESVKIATKTTYAQRGLLTPDEVTRSLHPERVMAAMIEAYGRAKAIVVEVGEATRRIGPRLEQAARALRELAIEIPGSSEVTALQSRIVVAQTQLARDPLGADQLVVDVDQAVTKLRREIEDARGERARVDGELRGAAARIAELEAAFTEAIAAHAERRDKLVLDPEPPDPCEPIVVDELARWVERLRQTHAAGKWQAAKIGLANWRAQVDARLAECAAITAENRRQLDRRAELRGLLDGLKAKAAATGRAEDPIASELYRKAHALLFARPTPLATAEQLVHQYLEAVR